MHFLPTIVYRFRKRPRLLPLFVFFFIQFSLLWPASNSFCQGNKSGPQEYGLKAIYLYNFLQFVHWPAEKIMKNGRKVEEIAVIGDSPIGASLQALNTELKRTQGTEISFRFYGPYKKDMDLSGCRLLFISQSAMKHCKRILDSIRDEPVLTVADSEEGLEQGCMIALLSRMNKVRWAINRKPVKQAGLRLNSRLLTMAVKVVE